MPEDQANFCGIYYCPMCGVLQKHTDLTATEVEILRAYSKGLGTKEIGLERCLSAKTVEAHRAKIILKIGAPNITAAVVWGIKHKIVLID